jgi:hypothetical protein
MNQSPTFLHLETHILPCVRQRIVKLKLLPLDRRAFLNLNIQALVMQVKDYDSVHLALPDELRPILRKQHAGK